jgi:hypothetical protein
MELHPGVTAKPLTITPESGATVNELITALGCYLLSVLLISPNPDDPENAPPLAYDLDSEESRDLTKLLWNVYNLNLYGSRLVSAANPGQYATSLPGRKITMLTLQGSKDRKEFIFVMNIQPPTPEANPADWARAFAVDMNPESWKNFYERLLAIGMVLPGDILCSFDDAMKRLAYQQLILTLN